MSPDIPQIHYNRGINLLARGTFTEALDVFCMALRLDPANPAYLAKAAFAAQKCARSEPARLLYACALNLNPEDAEVLFNLAGVFMELGIPKEAEKHFNLTLDIDPLRHEASFQLGNLAREADDYPQAQRHYLRAQALKPDFAEALYNRGFTCQLQGSLREAADLYLRSLALRPDYAQAKLAIAEAALMSGDLRHGFELYEARLPLLKERPFAYKYRADLRPETRLDKSGLNNIGSILVMPEGGFGDTLQFIRYVSHLSRLKAEVTLVLQKELTGLFRHLGDRFRIVAEGDDLPAFERHTSYPSLPWLFATDVDSIPAKEGYIRADLELSLRWRERLEAAEGMKIGLVWAGSSAHVADSRRSIPAEAIERIAVESGISALDKVNFFSLCMTARNNPGAMPKNPVITDLTGEISDFSDTAAIIDNLDLTLSIDSSVSHLCGAMGKPVWVLLSAAPDWRRGLSGEKDPWYASVRMFRQTIPGDWIAVLRKIFQEIRKYVTPTP